MPNDAPAEGSQRRSAPTRAEAFRRFATFDGPTQSQQHIKPLHEYVRSRLQRNGRRVDAVANPRGLRCLAGLRKRQHGPQLADGVDADAA